MKPLDLHSTVRLNNGVQIPLLGLGTYLATGSTAQRAVRVALECGYRHIDTATLYDNERHIGKAVRASGIAREQIFVTTKLWNSDHGYDQAYRACHQSLRQFGFDYVDLYLIHWPVRDLRRDSWRALERLLKEQKCRAIGVSNYMIHHLEEVLGEGTIAPAVNQIEFSPFLYQRELLECCRENGIELQAYSPLTKATRLQHPVLRRVAERYGRSPAQILIRWALQQQLIVLPKSSDPERIRENAQVYDFEIGPRDVQTLNALDEGLHTSWDPTETV